MAAYWLVEVAEAPAGELAAVWVPADGLPAGAGWALRKAVVDLVEAGALISAAFGAGVSDWPGRAAGHCVAGER